MKLTEAQLKRIIAEEVQIAIDEGIFDFARSAGRKIGDAYSAGVDALFDLPLALTADAVTNAVYAARSNREKRLIEETSELVNELAKQMEEISIIGLPETESALVSFMETLAGSIGASIEELPRMKRAIEKETLVGTAERPEPGRAKEMSRRSQAMGPGSRGSGTTASFGAGTMEEQADAITEAIIKRLTQKR